MIMKIGFIGAGNMGSAIIEGVLKSKIVSPPDITVSDANETAVQNLRNSYLVVMGDNKTAAQSDVLFLCVKPQVIYSVIEEIKDAVTENTVIVSIAAGQSIGKIENAFGKKIRLIRVMPNTPALVGEGMAALSPNANATGEDLKVVGDIFGSLGKSEIVPEHLMDAVTAVSGSSPAYVFMFIEAMADAAVQGGMPRSQAYTFAAQAVLGSAKMVLETGKHPADLKDMVCSPAGTTIDAVAELEKNGFRNAVIEAMKACIKKSKELG
ncbi:MAG: pyrroline-5-carboxylate reductase [Clostridia bacterium]|nr:pyrroline-5-carboxylate reductase [Clostridia bacterium]MBR0469818.1 pyrroline-5-carboxylate reductase [Clostridia bacterium]